jgi:hypothetical protein
MELSQPQAQALIRLQRNDDFNDFLDLLQTLNKASLDTLQVTCDAIELRREQGEIRRHHKILALLEDAETNF